MRRYRKRLTQHSQERDSCCHENQCFDPFAAESPRLSSPRCFHLPFCPVAPVAESSDHANRNGPALRDGCAENTPSGPPCPGPGPQPACAGPRSRSTALANFSPSSVSAPRSQKLPATFCCSMPAPARHAFLTRRVFPLGDEPERWPFLHWRQRLLAQCLLLRRCALTT